VVVIRASLSMVPFDSEEAPWVTSSSSSHR
jgi:hypothetical protein